MADEKNINWDDVICRFFLLSTCRDGDRCLLSHDSSRTVPDTVCRYFLQGTCAFGESCRYDHVFVGQSSDSKTHFHYNASATQPPASREENTAKEFAQPQPGTESANQIAFRSFDSDTQNDQDSSDARLSRTPKDWVNAPEFVPRSKRSYVEVLKTNIQQEDEPGNLPYGELCPLFTIQSCPFGEECLYVHGDVCELCGKACLHPRDETQRKAHIEACEKELELDMELSFAVQRSLGKTCGICMDVVLEKEPISERRFGILEQCNHVFCLTCIRRWRRSKRHERNANNALDPEVTRACPECRTPSDFVTPSPYYVDEEEEKKRLISSYKVALSKKPCRYFKQGKGTCPFGGSCFYLHALPDGTKVELQAPLRRRRQNQDGDLMDVNDVYLVDFIDHRDSSIFFTFDLVNFESVESDSDESEVNVDFWRATL